MRSPHFASVKAVLAATALVASELRAELVARWLFDEGSGTVYADSSGNGWHARPATPVTWSSNVPATGFANPASINFDGATGYVTTPFQGIGGAEARTVSFWVIGSTFIADNQWHHVACVYPGGGELGTVLHPTPGGTSATIMWNSRPGKFYSV